MLIHLKVVIRQSAALMAMLDMKGNENKKQKFQVMTSDLYLLSLSLYFATITVPDK